MAGTNGVTSANLASAAGIAPGGQGAGNWREAMAKALGTKLDDSAQKIVNDANAIAASSQAVSAAAATPVITSIEPGAGAQAAAAAAAAPAVGGTADSPSAMLLLTAEVGTYTSNSTLAGGATTQANEGEKTLARVS